LLGCHLPSYALKKVLAQVQFAGKMRIFAKKCWRKTRAEQDWDTVIFTPLCVGDKTPLKTGRR
jgi:hypothetical protein